MKLATVKVLKSVADNADIECKVREEYCGRGMATPAAAVVVSSLGSLLGLVAMAAVTVDQEGDYPGDFAADAGRFRFDNLGRDIVVY